MFFSESDLLAILSQYKYLVIFPIAVLEGPIITVICGFLVFLGLLNGPLAFSILFLGDLIGDLVHYALGRFWKNRPWFRRVAGWFGYNDEKEKIVEDHFDAHAGKTILIAKFSHGIGGFVQIVAGIAKMNFWKFFKFSTLATIPKSIALFFLGYYLGSSYIKINNYLGYFSTALIIFILVIIVYFISRSFLKKGLVEKW